MNKFLRVTVVLFFSLILTACGDPAEAAYEESVETGTEYLETGDLQSAEEQFQIALENKPEDIYVQNVLEQIKLYQEATAEFANDNNQKALELAEEAANIEEGSEVLNEKARTLREDIQDKIDEEIAEEKARKEEARIKAEKEAAEKAAEEEARKEEEARIQAEKEAAEKAAAEAEAAARAQAAMTYDDFKGIYGLYEGSTLTAVVIFSNNYMTDIYTDWNHIVAREISSTNVEDGVLYLDYLAEEGEGSPVTWPAGSFQVKLSVDENGRKVLTNNDLTLRQMSRSEFDTLGFTINSPEIFEGT
jgi:tetratricopeptide (TPR) repeat protein